MRYFSIHIFISSVFSNKCMYSNFLNFNLKIYGFNCHTVSDYCCHLVSSLHCFICLERHFMCRLGVKWTTFGLYVKRVMWLLTGLLVVARKTNYRSSFMNCFYTVIFNSTRFWCVCIQSPLRSYRLLSCVVLLWKRDYKTLIASYTNINKSIMYIDFH